MGRSMFYLLVRHILFLFIGVSLCWSEVIGTQDREQMLFEEIPVVITSSRKEQPITEAASAVTVITGVDIRHSGLSTIPDILRLVAGVDVLSITPRHQQVAVRGFVGPANNKLLVMIDGRTVYSDSYGMVFWDAFPVSITEIDRIEVVKSPASSLYGANAYTGVINIITSSPAKIDGTTVQMQYGDHNLLIGTVLHSGKSRGGKFQYKLSGEIDRLQEWQRDEDQVSTVTRFNGFCQFNIGKKTRLALSCGRGQSQNRRLYQAASLADQEIKDVNEYLQVDLEYAKLKFRFFYKNDKTNQDERASRMSWSWPVTTYNAEIFHSFQLGKSHTIICGLNFRHYDVSSNLYFNEEYEQQMWALYFEDEIHIARGLRLTLGGRMDTHPLAGEHLTPRGSLLYMIADNHVVRFSVAQAFRNPTFFDSYNYQSSTGMRPGQPPYSHIMSPFTFTIRGNTDLNPEGVVAYELGYQGIMEKRLRLDISLFYNYYYDFFALTGRYEYYEENELFPGSPGGVLPKKLEISTTNSGRAYGIGGEINGHFTFNEDISAFINYSYQEIRDKEDNILTSGMVQGNRSRGSYPKHKINAGFRAAIFKNFSIDLFGHWVGRSTNLSTSPQGPQNSETKDYLLLNGRFGGQFFKGKVEMGLMVFNIFDVRQYGFPMGMSQSNNRPADIGRRISLTARISF